MKNQRSCVLKMLVLIGFFCYSLTSNGQKKLYPLEKIYTQTDRPFYFPGERLWFKSLVVDKSNLPSGISDIVIAQLISPRGDVVKTKNIEITQGYAYGDFLIKKDWVGGVYSLRLFTNYMQNFGKSSFFIKEITVQKVIVPKLLMTLDFQRETYGKGSTVKADFEVEDLKNNPLIHQDVIAKILLKGKLFTEKKVQTDSKGRGIISFSLPLDLKTSDVVLNVEVPYRGSYESIAKAIPILMDNIDLQFLPEGGKLIAGIDNTLAFKALNEFGKPADVKGIIVNSKGVEIKAFESFHDGMGSVRLEGNEQTEYFAKITSPFQSDSLYLLPKFDKKGVKIALQEQQPDFTSWNVFTSNSTYATFQALDGANEILFQKTTSFKAGMQTIPVDIGQFPRGITKFRLISSKGEVLSERLLFLNNHRALNISVSLKKKVYAPREKVVMEIESRDANNKPISSNIAIAVTDNALLSFANDKQDWINSYLLMSSELQGKIHEPSFYFDPKEEKASKAIDLVMLTHGWRDYVNHSLEELSFMPHKRNHIEGQILNKKNKPVPAKLILFELNGKKALEFNTDEKGYFRCKLGNAYSYVLVAYREDRQLLKIVDRQIGSKGLKVIQNGFMPNISVPEDYQPAEGPQKPIQKPIQQKATFSASLTEDAQSLDEVVVVGYGVNSTKNALGFAQAAVTSEEISDLPGPINQLLQGRAAGVQITNSSGVSGSGTKIKIRGVSSIRGANQPLFIIDGIPYTDSFIGDQSSELKNLSPSDIESVSLIKGVAATALYGSRGVNGAIIINTKRGNYGYDDKVLVRRRFNNYAVKSIYKNSNIPSLDHAAAFYVPVYDYTGKFSERRDFRKTIYWNPVVQTDKNGKARLEFYNSDALTSFNITAEGISYNGLIGRTEALYSIQRPLSVSMKMPNYCSLNDTIKLPITLANNTEKKLGLKIDVDIPREFEVVNPYDLVDSVIVMPKDHLLKNLVLVPKKVGKDLSMRINVHNRDYADGLSQKVSVLSPYFPVETTISGSNNGNYSFSITNPVPKSARAQFKVYVDVIGDVMNGIEGMIRQPYGCFEQTSSATYPNVMILQYLKETAKSNPEIEVKAMDFIKKGYKKLVGFETSKGGFEWFGHTPPHETLTAFGILEFTEMKEVYDGVSDKMLSRTIKWLLSRKDGKGGFYKSKKGYDSFASSPAKVANAYIVYVLSEVGLTSEIEREYQSSLAEALKSEDAYRMALLALASENLGYENNYKLLVEKLLEQVRTSGYKGLSVDNTITRSYGKSKELETTAWVVLSLLRSDQYATEVVKGVQHITSNRTQGRFGSTQATVISLKALIEFTKKQKQRFTQGDNSISLRINGTTLERKLLKPTNGVLLIDDIERYLTEGKQKVEVFFKQSDKTFPYALDIQWESYLPKSSLKSPIRLETSFIEETSLVGNLARMEVVVTNDIEKPVSMTTAIIGIPSGAGLQPAQLKQLLDTNQVDYYEVFDNYLVLYWRSMRSKEKKTISLDLKSEIAGNYKAPASVAYLYYGDENKFWIEGTDLEISERMEK